MPKIQAPTVALHRELRRQQLIDAAMELALTDGAQSITVAAVATKAGLARSSIYEYFASSADLVADLVLEELDYYTQRLANAVGSASEPYLRIELWISESLRYVADGRHMLVKSLNTINTPEARKDEIAMGHRRMLAPLQQSLSEVGVGDVRVAAALLASITDAASIRIDAGNDAELEIQSAVIFALAGLRALAQK
ncbi:MAG TPA: TetR family transcriptional regulator [Candidatus Nanopelagicaceae bacterium]